MNERLKELVKQAESYASSMERETGAFYFDSYNEKFAELIVKDCLMVCKKTEQYEVGNQDPDEVGCIRAGGVFCREDIKEHFGVEK